MITIASDRELNRSWHLHAQIKIAETRLIEGERVVIEFLKRISIVGCLNRFAKGIFRRIIEPLETDLYRGCLFRFQEIKEYLIEVYL